MNPRRFHLLLESLAPKQRNAPQEKGVSLSQYLMGGGVKIGNAKDPD